MMKKKALGISIIALFLSGSFAFAQMGSGKDEVSKSGMHPKQMMKHGQMMGDMMGMSNRMSEMMGKMSNMMKDMPESNMKMMSGVMKDMSNEMMEMSGVMGSGKVSSKMMIRMQDKMMEIQKKMHGMEMHE